MDSNMEMEYTPPPPDSRVIERLATWLLEKRPWAYTGHKSTRSNAKPKELWIRFHKDTEVWWFEHFRYATEPFTDAGAKGPAYALFRDALPDALRIFRARKEGKPLDQIPPVEYLYRKGEFTKDGQPAVRAVKHFGRLPTDVARTTEPTTEAQRAKSPDGGAIPNEPVEEEEADPPTGDAVETAVPETKPETNTVATSDKKGYKCRKCGQPKKGHICKTSESTDNITKDAEEPIDTFTGTTGPTVAPVKKRKRLNAPVKKRIDAPVKKRKGSSAAKPPTARRRVRIMGP